MEREIKFRAWCVAGMFKVDDLYFDKGQAELNDGDIRSFKDIKLMQFTGLKDKNGKEIFEGDILRYGDKRYKIIIQIVWNDLSDNGFRILRQANKNILHDIRIYRFDEQAEVIGNIYENPELLKDKTLKSKERKR